MKKTYIVAHDVLSLPPQDAGIQKGIVRIHNSLVGREGMAGKFYRWQPVIVANPNTNREILRFVMGSPATAPIHRPNTILLDYDAKVELEWNDTHLLNVVPAPWWKVYAWYWRHPDAGYRVATRISLVSLLLGIISLVLGLIALF